MKAPCKQEQLDVSIRERERKIHRDPAGNRTWDLPITGQRLLPAISEPEAGVVDGESIRSGKVPVQSIHPDPQPHLPGIST